MRMIHRLTIPMLLLPMMLGCSSNEESELAAMARRELDRMSAQSESLMRHSQEVSETARHLVEADANARKELTEFQSRLQADIESERQNVDRQRDELESERRQIARATGYRFQFDLSNRQISRRKGCREIERQNQACDGSRPTPSVRFAMGNASDAERPDGTDEAPENRDDNEVLRRSKRRSGG